MITKWSAEHSVNVMEIDEQHRFFIELINLMREALDHNDSDSVLEKALALLIEYAAFHFETEEDLVKRCDYSGYDELHSQHQDLLNRLDKLLEQKQSGQDINDFYNGLMDYLIDWLNQHLIVEDKKFSECLNSHGIY